MLLRSTKNTSLPFIAGLMALVGSATAPAAQAPDLDPQIVKLVGSVSEEHLGGLLKKLEGFETRNTLSSTASTTRGIGAAREWILKEMQSYSPRLQVSFDSYYVLKQGRITRDVEIRNVVALLPGKSARRIYISGHYDTVAFAGGQGNSNAGGAPGVRTTAADPAAPLDNPAPGVNDDGSGTALAMELSRVFSQSGVEFDATLVFMAHVAEEQGLMGAWLHAKKAVDQKIPIQAVLNNDIVGGDKGGSGIVDGATIRVYSEGPEDSPSITRAPSGYDANLTWVASPGAVACRVFWREAWGPDWQHELAVGNVTNGLLPNIQIDDYVFGVAAIDAFGHESSVTAYVSPARAEMNIKTSGQ